MIVLQTHCTAQRGNFIGIESKFHRVNHPVRNSLYATVNLIFFSASSCTRFISCSMSRFLSHRSNFLDSRSIYRTRTAQRGNFIGIESKFHRVNHPVRNSLYATVNLIFFSASSCTRFISCSMSRFLSHRSNFLDSRSIYRTPTAQRGNFIGIESKFHRVNHPVRNSLYATVNLIFFSASSFTRFISCSMSRFLSHRSNFLDSRSIYRTRTAQRGNFIGIESKFHRVNHPVRNSLYATVNLIFFSASSCTRFISCSMSRFLSHRSNFLDSRSIYRTRTAQRGNFIGIESKFHRVNHPVRNSLYATVNLIFFSASSFTRFISCSMSRFLSHRSNFLDSRSIYRTRTAQRGNFIGIESKFHRVNHPVRNSLYATVNLIFFSASSFTRFISCSMSRFLSHRSNFLDSRSIYRTPTAQRGNFIGIESKFHRVNHPVRNSLYATVNLIFFSASSCTRFISCSMSRFLSHRSNFLDSRSIYRTRTAQRGNFIGIESKFHRVNHPVRNSLYATVNLIFFSASSFTRFISCSMSRFLSHRSNFLDSRSIYRTPTAQRGNFIGIESKFHRVNHPVRNSLYATVNLIFFSASSCHPFYLLFDEPILISSLKLPWFPVDLQNSHSSTWEFHWNRIEIPPSQPPSQKFLIRNSEPYLLLRLFLHPFYLLFDEPILISSLKLPWFPVDLQNSHSSTWEFHWNRIEIPPSQSPSQKFLIRNSEPYLLLRLFLHPFYLLFDEPILISSLKLPWFPVDLQNSHSSTREFHWNRIEIPPSQSPSQKFLIRNSEPYLLLRLFLHPFYLLFDEPILISSLKLPWFPVDLQNSHSSTWEFHWNRIEIPPSQSPSQKFLIRNSEPYLLLRLFLHPFYLLFDEPILISSLKLPWFPVDLQNSHSSTWEFHWNRIEIPPSQSPSQKFLIRNSEPYLLLRLFLHPFYLLFDEPILISSLKLPWFPVDLQNSHSSAWEFHWNRIEIPPSQSPSQKFLIRNSEPYLLLRLFLHPFYLLFDEPILISSLKLPWFPVDLQNSHSSTREFHWNRIEIPPSQSPSQKFLIRNSEPYLLLRLFLHPFYLLFDEPILISSLKLPWFPVDIQNSHWQS